MTKNVVERVVRKAYRDAYDRFPSSILMKQPSSAPSRYLLGGKAHGRTIRMWVDVFEKIITTAYPV